MATLQLPTAPGFARASWGLAANTQTFESPLTKSVQTLELTGARWQATYSPPTLRGDEIGVWKAFLVDLMGAAGRFFAVPPDGKAPKGTGGGTPLVNGAGQSGVSLITDGWNASELVLKAGDFFEVNAELKMVTADVTSDGTGNATIAFKPPLRQAPPDNSGLTLTDPACVMRLVDDEQGVWDIEGAVYTLSFSGIEVF